MGGGLTWPGELASLRGGGRSREDCAGQGPARRDHGPAEPGHLLPVAVVPHRGRDRRVRERHCGHGAVLGSREGGHEAGPAGSSVVRLQEPREASLEGRLARAGVGRGSKRACVTRQRTP